MIKFNLVINIQIQISLLSYLLTKLRQTLLNNYIISTNRYVYLDVQYINLLIQYNIK